MHHRFLALVVWIVLGSCLTQAQENSLDAFWGLESAGAWPILGRSFAPGAVLTKYYDRSFHYENAFSGAKADCENIQQAQIVFSVKGFVYDQKGNVVTNETIFRPSADVSLHASGSGSGLQFNQSGVGSADAVVRFFGRAVARPGAPSDAVIPLNVRLRGYAALSTTMAKERFLELHATAFSIFGCKEKYLLKSANVDVWRVVPYQSEYDESFSVHVTTNEVFHGEVWADCKGNAYLSEDLLYAATAFADPVIEIDPSYPHRDSFRLEFSPNILSEPEDYVPMPRLFMQGTTNGRTSLKVIGRTNQVCLLETTTNMAHPGWQILALITNVAGTAFFTDAHPTIDAQRYYRARIVK